MYKILFILLAFLFFSFTIHSQENNYHIKFKNLTAKEQTDKRNLYIGSFSLFLFYKNYISPQDHNQCPYHPSCSEFTYSAIKKHGIITGLIIGFERLSRCNRNKVHQYILNKDQKMIDFP